MVNLDSTVYKYSPRQQNEEVIIVDVKLDYRFWGVCFQSIQRKKRHVFTCVFGSRNGKISETVRLLFYRSVFWLWLSCEWMLNAVRLGLSRLAIRYLIAGDKTGFMSGVLLTGWLLSSCKRPRFSRISDESQIDFKFAKHRGVFVKKNAGIARFGNWLVGEIPTPFRAIQMLFAKHLIRAAAVPFLPVAKHRFAGLHNEGSFSWASALKQGEVFPTFGPGQIIDMTHCKAKGALGGFSLPFCFFCVAHCALRGHILRSQGKLVVLSWYWDKNQTPTSFALRFWSFQEDSVPALLGIYAFQSKTFSAFTEGL